MELLLYHLIKYIKENMPGLSMVDEDYGQLEAIDRDMVQTYPVTFPAVLLDAPDTEWSNLSNKSQRGKTHVIVRLVIDCYDDTHYGSDTTEAIRQRSEMVDSLHQLLQCYRPFDDSALIREKSKFYTWSHGIKVYELTYSIAVSEIIQNTMSVASPRVVVSARRL